MTTIADPQRTADADAPAPVRALGVPLLVVRLRGTQEEMGRQHGRILKAIGGYEQALAFYPRLPERLILGGFAPISRVTLSTFLRADLRARGELEARQSWTVAAARLAVAAPWAVLAVLSVNPTTLQAYEQPAGLVVLAVGGVASIGAYQAMRRIGRLPEDQRVLR